MGCRVGRPSKPFNPLGYTMDDVKFMYELVKKTDNVDLKLKLRHNIAESKRLKKNYYNAKKRIFGND